jgi:type II secretory ATPase GspE/PulE/Tfp pilus assembly ATPase PilB-like protein
VVQRLKVLARLMTYRTDVPQEGRLDPSGLGGAAPSLGGARVSVMPTVHGEKVVVRFFFARRGADGAGVAGPPVRLDELGLRPDDHAALTGLFARPEGLLLLTGPAGSGKTTTLYACLRHLALGARGARQIVSIEDPVENVQEGVTQVEINPAAGLDFAAALRALLRQDPEVVMVGEVRDRETAAIAVQAALTGHLILSTVHAASAPEVLLRLADLGVEPSLIAGVVTGVLAQRLVRRLCLECRTATANPEEPYRAGPRSAGCLACRGTGYRGRILVAELLRPSDAMRTAFRDKPDRRRLLDLAAEQGCVGLWRRGLERLREGHTTLLELRRVVPPPDAERED